MGTAAAMQGVATIECASCTGGDGSRRRGEVVLEVVLGMEAVLGVLVLGVLALALGES